MSKPHEPGDNHHRNRANRRRKKRRRTTRKPKTGKGKSRRLRNPGQDMLNVACTRCDYRVQMNRVVFGRESRRSGGCRCPLYGGNVVLAKFVDAHEKALTSGRRRHHGDAVRDDGPPL